MEKDLVDNEKILLLIILCFKFNGGGGTSKQDRVLEEDMTSFGRKKSRDMLLLR